ncbi:MAG: hypothetical protein A2137_02485, partial [Chloroflexi bacterium RBG_16_58_8]
MGSGDEKIRNLTQKLLQAKMKGGRRVKISNLPSQLAQRVRATAANKPRKIGSPAAGNQVSARKPEIQRQPDVPNQPDATRKPDIARKPEYVKNPEPLQRPNLVAKSDRRDTAKLDLLEKIWNKVKPEEKENKLIASIMRMTHSALGAAASSFLLLDEETQELYFKFADGPVAQHLKRLHIDRQSGIAGWIARNGKPLVVNDPGKNANFYKLIDNATGFRTKSIIGVPIIINNKVAGVIEVLNRLDGKNFSREELKIMTNVANTAAITLENARMGAELLNSFKHTVRALVSLADTKESSGGGHSRRVSEYALMGATELGLSREEKQVIEYAAILHDIGKLSIADAILNKTGQLTEQDWAAIKKHPLVGYQLLKDIPLLKEASKLIYFHHERY